MNNRKNRKEKTMKRNHYYFHAICLMGMVAMASACSENALVDESVADGKVLTSITASMPTDASSRVTLTDGTTSISQVWKTGDKIFINGNQTNIAAENQFTLDKGANSATGATFKGNLTYSSTTKFFAYYPVSSNWTKGTTSGVMAFNFANQDGTLEGLANFAVMAAVATPSAPLFQFHNMTALMKFNFTFPDEGESSAASAGTYYFKQTKMYNNGKPAYESGATHEINWYPQDVNTLGGIKLTLPSASAALTAHKSTVYFAMPAGWMANSVYQQASTKDMIINVPVGSGYYAGIIGKDQLLEPGKMYTVSKKLVAAQYANAAATTFTDNNTGDFWLIENADAYCLAGVTSALNALKTANSTRKITLVLPSYTDTDVTTQFAQGCTNLEKVYIPAATGVIPYRTFENCTSLTTFSAPYATSVGTADDTSSKVFYGCTALTNVDIPNVTTIGSNAFDGCSALTSISLPKVTSIGDQAFANTALTEINLPMLQTITGGEVFNACTNLTKITLGGGTDWGGFTGINSANLTSLFSGLGNTTCSLYLPAGQTVNASSKQWTVLLKGGTTQTQTISVSVFAHVYVGGTLVF
jgi:hypothetical protein